MRLTLNDIFYCPTLGTYVYLDTQDTFDRGWETMAFPCIIEHGQPVDVDFGTEIVTRLYPNLIEAQKGHFEIGAALAATK